MIIERTREVVELLAPMYLEDDSIVCDFTLGNGHDSLFLLRQIKKGFLYGFDIQEEAIKNSHDLLTEAGFKNFKLILDSHANVLEHVKEKIDLGIYNLGYLPGGDKALITKGDSTVKSIESALKILNPGKVLIITAYKGHKGAMEEYESVMEYVSSLDQKKYSVMNINFPNQRNNPPEVITVGVK